MITIEGEGPSTLQEGAPCLHCLVHEVILQYWQTFGALERGGRIGIDITLTLAKLAEVMASIVSMIESSAEQDGLIDDMKAMVDAAFEASRTGETVEVTVGVSKKVH